jgi:hypothetical protein
MKTAKILSILALVFCFVGSATADWTTVGNNMYSNVSGNVGIGTTNPGANGKLTIVGTQKPSGVGDGLEITSSRGSTATNIALLANNAAGVINPLMQAGDNILRWAGSSIDNPNAGGLVLGPWSGSPKGIRIAPDGNVGIGTSTPTAKLEVNGDIKWGSLGGVLRADGTLELGGSGTPYIDFHKDMSSDFDARIKLVDNWLVMQTDGVAICDVVTGEDIIRLGKGMDYAEGFDVSGKDNPTPGTVLIIDPENPGQLALSRRAYDKRVAGIVAGAKGLGSGVRLGSNELDTNKALAGRVYCNVDATETAVEPGDLLTTSPTAGYAMKVTDYVQAQGATLGKAMERLEKGKKGQILVLVTLQ